MAEFREEEHPRDNDGKFKYKGASDRVNELVDKYSDNPEQDKINSVDNKKIKFKEDLPEKTQDVIKDIEDTIKGLNYEVGTIIDKDGNVLQTVDGSSNEVYLEKSLLKNAILTHNHPNGSCFSHDDIQGFLDGEVYQLRVTTDKGKTYILTRTKDFVVPSLAYNYKKASSYGGEGQNKIQELYEYYLGSGYSGGMAKFQAISDYNEEWLLKNGNKYNVKFEVKWDE